MDSEYIIEVNDATVRFNMASEKIDNLKEYVIKFIKRELMFQEFLALKDINLKIKPGEAWGGWNKRFWKVNITEAHQRYFETI